MGVLSFYRDNYTLFRHNYITEFVKNADSIYVIVVTPFSRKVSLATIGVCVFSAVYFGSRTFYFGENRYEKMPQLRISKFRCQPRMHNMQISPVYFIWK